MSYRVASICMALQHEYSERYEKLAATIATLNPGDPRRSELADLRSLYATIVVASIRFMPEAARENAAAAIGRTIERAVVDLAPDLVPVIPAAVAVPRLKEPV